VQVDGVEVDLHQLELRHRDLRIHDGEQRRRLIGSVAEIGQQVPVVVIRDADRLVLIDGYLRVAGSGNSDLTDSGNSDHPGASSDRRGPSIAAAKRRGKAKDDRHGQKARDPGPASSRTQPGRDQQAGRRLAKQHPARRR
jgi:hypothetical protein